VHLPLAERVVAGQGLPRGIASWQVTLAKRVLKASILCGLDEPPPWTFDDYFRDGDPDDMPLGREKGSFETRHSGEERPPRTVCVYYRCIRATGVVVRGRQSCRPHERGRPTS
jgi:hypothetical protein